MKQLVIDSSSLISLSSNCLLWVLDKIKESLNTQFIITPGINKEVTDKPLNIDKFRLGGVRIQKRLSQGTIITQEEDSVLTEKIYQLSNSIYSINNKPYRILSKPEIGLLTIAKQNNTNLIVIDERITEKLINDPLGLKMIFENRHHTKVGMNLQKLNELKKLTEGITVIKSADLIAIAYERGILNDYMKSFKSKKSMKDFISGALWGLKISGCAISTKDINEYMKELF